MGKINNIEAKYVSIKTSDSETTCVRINDRTKMGRVAVKDEVKAYVSEAGYAATVQRVSDSLSVAGQDPYLRVKLCATTSVPASPTEIEQ